MDQPTCYTVICLLTGACGALLYLWHRAAARVPGEYRQVAPTVELPPTGALAEDLYAAHRGARMMVDKSTCPPLALAGCDDGQRAGWRAVAVRVEAITRPPKTEGTLMVGGRGTLTSIPVLVVLGLCACASQLTRDRQQLTAVLQVQRAAVVRLQSGDAACQGKIVAAAKTREMAVRQLAAYRDRRRVVEQQVATAARAADEAQDQLLLSNSPAAADAVVKAREAAAQLRAQVQQLVEGC